MKALKITMLVIGSLAFISFAYNIVELKLQNQWFGLVSGAFLVWCYFNINKTAFEKVIACPKHIIVTIIRVFEFTNLPFLCRQTK